MKTENKKYTINKLGYELVKRKVKWADLNKNNDLEDYKNEVEKGDFSYQDVIIKQIVFVDNSNWKYLTNSFLEDNDIWETIGGHDLTKYDKETFLKLNNGKEMDKFFNCEEEAKDFFKKNCKALVTELINNSTGETIYINTEGYKYARYVGITSTKEVY